MINIDKIDDAKIKTLKDSYMTAKFTITFLLFIIFTKIHSQDNSISIFGKWQHVREYSNDGVHDHVEKIKNGEILVFEKKNIVQDSLGNKGNYYLDKNILIIKLNGTNREYNISFSEDNNIMSASPTHAACFEGCSSTYSRLKNSN